MGRLPEKLLIVGDPLVALVQPVKQLGYNVLYAEDIERCFYLAGLHSPGIVLLAESIHRENIQMKEHLERVLNTCRVLVLSAAAVPALLMDKGEKSASV